MVFHDVYKPDNAPGNSFHSYTLAVMPGERAFFVRIITLPTISAEQLSRFTPLNSYIYSY